MNKRNIKFENIAEDMGACVRALMTGDTDNLNRYELHGLCRILEYAKDIVELQHIIDKTLDNYEY